MTGDAAGVGLTHIDERGRAVMVDVTNKAVTHRRAIASSRVAGFPDAPKFVTSRPDLFTEARLAAIAGAKATSTLVPLCHPLPLDAIAIDFSVTQHEIEITAMTATIGQTGVEMEALTACALAALAVLGRARKVHRSASIEDLGLQEKRGGRSGLWRRESGGSVRDAAAAGDPGS
jgi:cyclic pyranopterin phosphate synthase